jgi:hypothetical protein
LDAGRLQESKKRLSQKQNAFPFFLERRFALYLEVSVRYSK